DGHLVAPFEGQAEPTGRFVHSNRTYPRLHRGMPMRRTSATSKARRASIVRGPMEPDPPMIEIREAERTSEQSPSAGGLAELYERHAGAAIGLAYLLTGDRYHAEDLVQEAFVRVAGRFRHLRDEGAFEGYLRRTVVNLFTSQLRRRRLER